jgi:hypothetical protein
MRLALIAFAFAQCRRRSDRRCPARTRDVCAHILRAVKLTP